MVRNYKKKGVTPKYTEADLQAALDEVRAGSLTVHKASSKYNIPKMTLSYRIRGLRGQKSSNKGRPTSLPAQAEADLAKHLTTMEKWGWGLSRNEVLDIVRDYVTMNNIKTPFKNNRPGKDWFILFRQRHGLSLKKPQSVEYARRKCLDPFVINEYFDLLHNTISDLGLADKPGQIFNLDETNFNSDPSRTKVVGKKNKPASRTVSGPGRENTTVVICASSSGLKLPPHIVFKGKNIWDEWMAPEGTGFPGTTYAATKNGWMEKEVFVNYIKNNFVKQIGAERPVLLIYDGHSSHIDPALISYAISEQITILKLPPHSSHLLQPLDISVFRSMKIMWDDELVKWQRRNVGHKFSKKLFSQMVGQLWLKLKPQCILNGFKKAGIYPFDRHVIPNECFDPAALARWREHNRMSLNQVNTHPDNFEPEASAQSTSSQVRFEELLLETVKQSPREIKTKKRRVATGAEVITIQEIDRSLKKVCQREDQKEAKKEVKKKLIKKKQQSSDEDTGDDNNNSSNNDEEHSETVSECSDTDEDLDWQEAAVEYEKDEELNRKLLSVTNPIEGDWVLIRFSTNKNNKFFVGKILAIGEVDASVKFLRRFKSSTSTFVWPHVDDISVVARSDIENVLPPPVEDRRGKYTFGIAFDGYNIY